MSLSHLTRKPGVSPQRERCIACVLPLPLRLELSHLTCEPARLIGLANDIVPELAADA
jgi:hypothetical protein